MANCILKSTCSQLQELLRQMKVEEDIITTDCADDGPCQSVFDNTMLVTHYLNVDNAKQVGAFLRRRNNGRLPIDSSGSTVKQIFDRRPFACPELDIEIRQPCRVRSCSYWTNHAWTQNCILFYRADQGRDGLDLKELTFLLDQTSMELRKHTNTVLAEMRRWALRNKTEQLEEQSAPTIVKDGCCVCGIVLGKDSLHKLGFNYCGRVCCAQKPPLDLRIEQEFRLPIGRVLNICIDSFAAKRPMCHALNVTSKQLDDLCSRHAAEVSTIS